MIDGLGGRRRTLLTSVAFSFACSVGARRVRLRASLEPGRDADRPVSLRRRVLRRRRPGDVGRERGAVAESGQGERDRVGGGGEPSDVRRRRDEARAVRASRRSAGPAPARVATDRPRFVPPRARRAPRLEDGRSLRSSSLSAQGWVGRPPAPRWFRSRRASLDASRRRRLTLVDAAPTSLSFHSFLSLSDALGGAGGAFACFAGVCLCHFVFAHALVPELKGRSLEQIESGLREATGNAR